MKILFNFIFTWYSQNEWGKKDKKCTKSKDVDLCSKKNYILCILCIHFFFFPCKLKFHRYSLFPHVLLNPFLYSPAILKSDLIFGATKNNGAWNECEYAFPTTNHLGGMVKPAIIQSLQFQTPFVISLNKQGNLNFHSF